MIYANLTISREIPLKLLQFILRIREINLYY